LKEIEFEANVFAELGYKISNLVRVFKITVFGIELQYKSIGTDMK